MAGQGVVNKVNPSVLVPPVAMLYLAYGTVDPHLSAGPAGLR
jgi:hypothetical protein